MTVQLNQVRGENEGLCTMVPMVFPSSLAVPRSSIPTVPLGLNHDHGDRLIGTVTLCLNQVLWKNERQNNYADCKDSTIQRPHPWPSKSPGALSCSIKTVFAPSRAEATAADNPGISPPATAYGDFSPRLNDKSHSVRPFLFWSCHIYSKKNWMSRK